MQALDRTQSRRTSRTKAASPHLVLVRLPEADADLLLRVRPLPLARRRVLLEGVPRLDDAFFVSVKSALSCVNAL